MKVNVTTIGLALHLVIYTAPAWCSDKDAQAHLRNTTELLAGLAVVREEKNQSWSGPLMLQSTDLVALSETMNAGARLKLLDALERENTGTSLPQEKVNGFVRKHRQSIVTFNKEDPRLAAMALAASEAAFWAEHAQVMGNKQ